MTILPETTATIVPVVAPVAQPAAVAPVAPVIPTPPVEPVAPIPPPPIIFQMAPPAAPAVAPVVAPAAPVVPVATPQPAATPDYKEALDRYKNAALAALSDADKGLVERLSGGDPIKTLDVLRDLQASGKLGAPVAAQPAPPVVPAAPGVVPVTPVAPGALPPVDRQRVGGSTETPVAAPKTPEEASRRMARQLKGKRVVW